MACKRKAKRALEDKNLENVQFTCIYWRFIEKALELYQYAEPCGVHRGWILSSG